MSTGDLKNHGTRLQSLLRTTKYSTDINYQSLFYGCPQEYLPLLHYLFQDYSLSFSKYLLKQGYEMSGKSDKQFIDVVYKVLRDEFEYVPRLSKDKFFSNGFTEQKLILTNSIYQYVIDKCRSFRKQKPKNVSNKENANPNKTRSVNKQIPKFDQSSLVAVELPDETVEPEEVPLPCPEHSPMRRAPQPNISQPYDLSDVIDESIIEIPIENIQSIPPATPQTKVYSEMGAREVFALDHLTANPMEIVDSTPHTVLNSVQLVPVGETCEMIPVSVTREVEEKVSVETKKQESGSLTCATPCCHAADIADIKNYLVTISARLDILESKAKHPGKQNFIPAPEMSFPVALNNVHVKSTFCPAPNDSQFDESLQKFVTFDESVTSNSSTSSVSTSAEDNEDAIKNFLKTVQERLHDTRSFLRTYDTS
ncbi:centrosomal protein of 44 kDa-like [Bolinopsis microptera]|uniref:centrosomal protein of 44 kDa-like n=1 Tax=Bolinopsis microptera TaxID=2820187 RepID=UPI003078B205